MIPAKKSFLGELLVFGICRRSLWSSFHSVQVRIAEPLPAPPSQLDAPIIFYSNHSTWWDGYLAHVLMRQVYGLSPYLMMDEKQLARYRFFSWAGCFGVNREDGRAALKSLEYIADELPKKPGNALWMFPQGEITPQEKRPLDFHTGLGWLVRRIGNCYVYPVSFRFEYMREQFPDIFINVGLVQRFKAGEKLNNRQLTQDFERTLIGDMNTLREDVNHKHLDDFVTIIKGKGSTDTAYSNVVEKILGKKRPEA